MAYTVNLRDAQHTATYSKTRMAVFKDRYDMYSDNYRKLVERRLTEIYSKASLLRMDKQIDMTNNVYKAIVDKISKVYSYGVIREFKDENMEQFYTDSRIDKYMAAANKYVNAFNDLLLQVSWDTDNDKVRFIFRYPHKTRVAVDENNLPVEVEYFVESLDSGEKWAYWNKYEHYYRIYSKEDDFTIESVPGNKENVNPYGVLPFVFMQNGFRDEEFFNVYSGMDMVEVTLDMAVYNTFKNYMIKWQSFKQIVVQGSNVGVIKGQVLDPSTALTAEGTDIKIDVLDLQANIRELSDTIDKGMTNVAINYNISPSQFRMTGQVSSGFALQMENSALDDDIRAQQDDFKDYEKELHDLLIIVGNVNNANFKEDSEFTVMFNEPSYPESRESKLSSDEKAIQLGLTNAIDIIMQEKEIPIEEATIEYNSNLTLRNQANENLNKPELTTEATAQAMGLDTINA